MAIEDLKAADMAGYSVIKVYPKNVAKNLRIDDKLTINEQENYFIVSDISSNGDVFLKEMNEGRSFKLMIDQTPSFNDGLFLIERNNPNMIRVSSLGIIEKIR